MNAKCLFETKCDSKELVSSWPTWGKSEFKAKRKASDTEPVCLPFFLINFDFINILTYLSCWLSLRRSICYLFERPNERESLEILVWVCHLDGWEHILSCHSCLPAFTEAGSWNEPDLDLEPRHSERGVASSPLYQTPITRILFLVLKTYCRISKVPL